LLRDHERVRVWGRGDRFGASGRLYVALFAKNQLSILDSDGTESAQVPEPGGERRARDPRRGPLRARLRWARVPPRGQHGRPDLRKGPGGIDPPGGLVTSDTWVVFDVFVDDTAAPLFRPLIPEHVTTRTHIDPWQIATTFLAQIRGRRPTGEALEREGIRMAALALALAILAAYSNAASGRNPIDRRYHNPRRCALPRSSRGIAIDGNTAYVDTFNPVDRAADDYDAIFTYDLASGTLRSDRPNPIKVPRMMSPTPMGLAAIALDAQGLLYVADMNGRILRLDPATGNQSDYANLSHQLDDLVHSHAR